MKLRFLAGFTALFFLPLFAQAQGMHSCGTALTAEDFELMRDRALQNRQVMNETAVFRDDDITYIPIKYNLIGRSDGSGTAKMANILGLHCKLNEEYAPHDIQFYMNDGPSLFYNDNTYENPANNETLLYNWRANDAINVWIGNSANVPGQGIGLTLGYYSPADDWIVIRKSEATYGAETLAHEVGHFLSLNHPFFGWDCTYYEEWKAENPDMDCAPTIAPCFNNPVERQNGSNCQTSGDFICDTPPDYNLGFQAPGCAYNGNACDPQGTQVEPMATNIMSYFSGCEDPEFTDEQIEMVFADYNSGSRNYLRIDGGPTFTEAPVSAPTITYPEDDAELDNYNVSIGWEAVENAEYYLVQTDLVNNFSLFLEETVVTEPGVTLDYLDENTTYLVRVSAYNEVHSCVTWSGVVSFTTGSNLSSTVEIPGVSDFSVNPNPAPAGSQISLNLNTQSSLSADFSLISVSGQVVLTNNNMQFSEGQNSFNLPAQDLKAGVYFAVLRSGEAVINRKIVVY